MSLVKMIEKRVVKKVTELDDIDKYPSTLKEGIAFSYYALEQIFKNHGEIEPGIVDSGYREEKNDYGIDAIYITGNKEIIEDISQLDEYNGDSRFEFNIFQFKKGNSLDVETILKLKEGIEKVFINFQFPEEDNEYMYERMKKLQTIRERIFEEYSWKKIKVRVYLCFSGSKDLVLKDTNLVPRFEDIKTMLLRNGYRNVDVEIFGAQELLDLEHGMSDITEIIKTEKSFKYIPSGDDNKKFNGYIAIVNAKEIALLVEKWQNSLFEANIRDYYSNNSNNNKIIQTASSDEEARFFWSFNNGLTITCREVDELSNGKLKLQGLQIVNGCQTSNSIYQAYKNANRIEELKQKSDLTSKEAEEVEKLRQFSLDDNTHILLKIIETEDDDLVYRITETTNSQTAISAFSIRANDDIHKNIERFMKDYNVYYERRVNFYRNKGVVAKQIVDIKKLSQVFVAMISHKPSQAMANPKKMFISNYEKIFPNPKQGFIDYELYTIPVLVQQQVEQKIKSIQRSKLEKDEFKKKIMSYGKFHLGCFILFSMLGKKYNPKGIKENFKKITTALQDDVVFQKHFNVAIEELKDSILKFTNNKDEIYSVLKTKEIDTEIVRTINTKGKKKASTVIKK